MEQEKQLLEVRIFITAMLLQELLDETDGNTKFKGRIQHHINGLIDGLEDILSENIDDDTLSLYLTQAAQALEDSMGGLIT